MAVVSKRAISSAAINAALVGATTDLTVGRNITATAGTVSGVSLQAALAGQIYFASGSVFACPTNGSHRLSNNASTAYTSLLFATGVSTDVGIYIVTGAPEGVTTARIGSLALRIDGGAVTSLYVKESGTGNTGWVAK